MGTDTDASRGGSLGRTIVLVGGGVLAVLVLVVVLIGGGLMTFGTTVSQDDGAVGPVTDLPVGDTARERDPSIGLDLALGFADQAPLGATVPAFVTISPSRPLQGELWVSTAGEAGSTTVLDVTVAAGATKRWVIPIAPGGENTVTATVLADDAVMDQVVQRDAGGTSQLAGILGDDEFVGRVGAVTDPYTGDVWTAAPIDPVVLDQPAAVLESIATLVAPQDALDALDESARSTLHTAVMVGGLHLVVTDVTSDPGVGRAPAALLDGQITPTSAAFPLLVSQDGVASGDPDRLNAVTAVSGTGRVTWLGDVPREAVDDPRTWGDLWTGSPAASQVAWNQVPVDSWQLLQDGITLPSSWAMSGFALLWMVLVGVVAARVSRSSRRMRGWVVLPAMSLVVAATAFLLAQGTTTSGGRALAAGWWIDGVGEQGAMVVQGPDAAPIELVGPGWIARANTWEHTVLARPHPQGLSVDARSDFGGATVVWASRATPQAPPATIEAVVTAAGTRAEITVGPRALRDARLVAPDGRAVELGDLAAASTTVVRVGDDAAVDGEPAEVANADWRPATRSSEGGVEGDDGGTWVRSIRRTAERHDNLVWLLATGDDVLDGDPQRATQDLDLLAVGTTPTVQPPATVAPSTTAWQAEGRADGGIDAATNRLDQARQAWVRVALPTPAAIDDVRLTIPAAQPDACESWLRHRSDAGGDLGDQDVQLCDGDEPQCPDDADFCEGWANGVSWCAGQVCEEWTRQDAGNSVWEVWDPDAQEWRVLDGDGVAAVESDPRRFLTPLGDLVLKVDARGGAGSALDPIMLEARP